MSERGNGMADYPADKAARYVASLLSGEHLRLPPERIDWAGYAAVLEAYRRADPRWRRVIEQGIKEILDCARDGEAPKGWGVVADAIHLAYALRIESVRETIAAIPPVKAGAEGLEGQVARECKNYLLYYPNPTP